MVTRLSRSNFSEKEIEAVTRILKIGYTAMGPEVGAFEKDIQHFLGGEVGISCVNTGTAALHLACQAVGLGVGDEILIPGLTFVASFQAASATGATPVPCDVSLNDGNLCLKDAAKRITSKTKAIMYVHYASNPGDLKALYDFSKKHKLRVIEDAAHSFGCKYQGNLIGTIGDVICFSFDGIKNITSGEGGAVVSRDLKIIQKVNDARLLGIENDTEKRLEGGRSWTFNVSEQGWRYHMSDLMAAIGRVQLRRFIDGEISTIRAELAEVYRNELASVKEIQFFNLNKLAGDLIIPHIIPIKVNKHRDDLRDYLLSKNIQVGFHYHPSHLLDKFSLGYGLERVEEITSEILTLPLHTLLKKEDVLRISKEVKGYFAQAQGK